MAFQAFDLLKHYEWEDWYQLSREQRKILCNNLGYTWTFVTYGRERNGDWKSWKWAIWELKHWSREWQHADGSLTRRTGITWTLSHWDTVD